MNNLDLFKGLKMIRSFLFWVTAMCTATSVTAETRGCSLSKDFCVPFIGCSLKTGDFYAGYSLGQRTGPVFATSKSGVTCQGEWWRNAIGAGRAKFTCGDGATGNATYTYFDSKTGTASGSGRTNTGDKLRFWAGHNVLSYVLAQESETEAMISCVANGLKQGG